MGSGAFESDSPDSRVDFAATTPFLAKSGPFPGNPVRGPGIAATYG
jgi:hypothetical protein